MSKHGPWIAIFIVVFAFVAALVSVVAIETARCGRPQWVELGDAVNGGTLLVKTSSMTGAYREAKDKSGTRIVIDRGASVIVTESIDDLKEMLCMGRD